MPLPLIIAGAVMAGGAIKGAFDKNKAKKIIGESLNIYESEHEATEKRSKEINDMLITLGAKKALIISTVIKSFLDYRSKIAGKEFSHFPPIVSHILAFFAWLWFIIVRFFSGVKNDDTSLYLSTNDINNLENSVLESVAIVSAGVSLGVGTGLLASAGTLAAAKTFGSVVAGSGVYGIATGVTASSKSYVLAKLGGGFINAGGAGAVGGQAALVAGKATLGTIIAVPTMIITGVAFVYSGYNTMQKAKEKVKEIENEAKRLIELRGQYDIMETYIYELDSLLERVNLTAVEKIELLISIQPDNFSYKDEDCKKLLSDSKKNIKLLKNIINIPIINDEGISHNETADLVVKAKENLKLIV